jgi:AcrR family transcriptional regulator
MKKSRERAPRMSSGERHEHILKHASTLILRRGVSSFTLEDVAEDARISKALVYKHFANKDALLKALAEHELKALKVRGISELPPVLSFDDAVREASARLFRYLDERGPVLQTMLGDREVAKLIGADAGTRGDVTDYFVEKGKRSYRMAPEVTLICALMTAHAPFGVARALKRRHLDPRRAADIWSVFVLGGWSAVASELGGGAARAHGRSAPAPQLRTRRARGSKRAQARGA